MIKSFGEREGACRRGCRVAARRPKGCFLPQALMAALVERSRGR